MKLSKVLSLLLVIVMVFTIACAEVQSPAHVEELIIGTCSSMEPCSMMAEGGVFGHMNYTGFCAGTFLTRDENLQIQPYIMTDWEVSEDSKEMLCTFATDKGILWHDGVPLSMDDIEFTLNFCKDNDDVNYLQSVTGYEVVSDTQIRFFFETPRAYWTLCIMAIWQRVFPKHIWENIEDPENYTGDDRLIGCGTYKLTNIDMDASTFTYEAAAETFIDREITVDKVIVRSYGSQDALVMALCNGEVDAMFDYSAPIESSMLSTISNVENLNIGESSDLGNYMLEFGFKQYPTNDINFRKAVSKALNYPLLAALLTGEDGQVAGTGILPPSALGFDASLPMNEQDVESAKAILDEAGFVDADGDGFRETPDGEAMDIMISPCVHVFASTALLEPMLTRAAEIIQANLKDIGIKTTIDEECIRNRDYSRQLRKDGTYELLLIRPSMGINLARTAYSLILDDEVSGIAYGSCLEPDISEVYLSLMSATNAEEYNAAVEKLQNMNNDNVYGIGLGWGKCYFPYRTDKYDGWINGSSWGAVNSQTWYNLYTK